MSNRYIYTPFFIDQPQPDIEQLAQPDWEANKPEFSTDNRYIRMASLNKRLTDFTAKTVIAGDRPVSVNGDCCAAIGMMSGLQRAGINPILIWLDAHGDFNTSETTPSGFIGGMPLAMLVGRGDQTLMQQSGAKPLPEQDVILSDARDLDIAEGAAVRSSKMHHINYLDDLVKFDLADRPLYIHFDTDILNPDDAPAMAYPANGGPKLDMLLKLMRHLAATKRIAAVSMTVWDMAKDSDKRTQNACLACFNTLIDDTLSA